MSGIKKPGPVAAALGKSAIASPSSATKSSIPPASGLKTPLKSPASPTPSVASTASPAPSTRSNSPPHDPMSSSSSTISELDLPPNYTINLAGMADSDRIQALLPTSSMGGNQNISVCVRLRPLNAMERSTRQYHAWTVRDNIIFQNQTQALSSPGSGVSRSQPKPQSFMFDSIFNEQHDNEHIFDKLGRPLLMNAMEGYHSLFFAYGQTSSGKTHSIHGSSEDPGMIPRSVEGIFDFIERCEDRVFTLRVSYLEIYNEIVNDLLNPLNTNLLIREDAKKGVFVDKLKEEIVISPEQVFALLAAGESNRRTAKTNFNELSSRSHTIFRIVIESMAVHGKQAPSKATPVRCSVLNIVDLAGSENVSAAHNPNALGAAVRTRETGFINRSLLTLGHVLMRLSEQKPNQPPPAHIPYRDSKLTRILQNSLSGKACVAVVCNLSPSSGNIEESLSTLKFASRAKKIRSQASVNELVDQSALIIQYQQEIDRLKTELAKYQAMPPRKSIANAGEAGQSIDSSSAQSPSSASQSIESGDADPSDSPYPEGLLLDPIDDSEENQNALNAQIEQLTRMILHSSNVADETNPATGTSSSSTAAPSGSAAASKSAESSKDSSSLPMKLARKKTFGTLSAKSPYMNEWRGTLRTKNLAELASAAGAAAPAAAEKEKAAESAAPAAAAQPQKPAAVAAEEPSGEDEGDLADLSRAQLIQRLRNLEQENRTLQNALDQSAKDLKSWEEYFIQNQNKLEAKREERRLSKVERRNSKLIATGKSPTKTPNNPAEEHADEDAEAAISAALATLAQVDNGPSSPEIDAAVSAIAAASSQSSPQPMDSLSPSSMAVEGQQLMSELEEMMSKYDSPSGLL